MVVLSLVIGLGAAFSQKSWTAVFWLLSLLPLLVVTRDASTGRPRSPVSWSRSLALGAAALLPVLVRVANLDPTRLHGDELTVAYFSHTHDFVHSSFFGLMPEPRDWIARFPKPFFLLQHAFFDVFGANLTTIRLSVLPYVAIVSCMLFLIAEELFDRRAAWVAVVLYSFFAPSVYLETIGVHFISATAAFAFFFHRALRLHRTGRPFDAAAAGLACGLCYLGYYSSYLAFPVLLAFAALGVLRASARRALANLAIACGGLLIVVAPFVASMVVFHNRILYRASQIYLLTGEWSPHRQPIALGTEKALPVVRDNLVQCLRALVRDGVGGQGGYELGKLAFFDGLSLALFLVGSAACLWMVRRRPELLLVLGVIAASFLGYVVLTIAPPAWHRFSVAFPFVALVMAIPFWALDRLSLPAAVRIALPSGVLLLYAIQNECRLSEAVMRDPWPHERPLLQLLQQRFGDRRVVIAGDRNAHLQKVFHFWNVPRSWDAQPVPQRTWLKTLDVSRPYVCVVNESFRYRKEFERADPKGRYYAVTAYYGIFAKDSSP